MNDLTFITGNANKAAYLESWLHHPVKHQRVDVPEIQSLDVREVVGEKAKSAFAIVGSPVLTEDVSMHLLALGGLPGPFVKWFQQAMGLEDFCNLLDGKDRSAKVICCYGLYDGKNLHFFEGGMQGTIAKKPQGDRGFGFDPVFINKVFTKTRGEMTEAEYEQTSMRKLALDKLAVYLQTGKNKPSANH